VWDSELFVLYLIVLLLLKAITFKTQVCALSDLQSKSKKYKWRLVAINLVQMKFYLPHEVMTSMSAGTSSDTVQYMVVKKIGRKTSEKSNQRLSRIMMCLWDVRY
jgi:hypothetical protein